MKFGRSSMHAEHEAEIIVNKLTQFFSKYKKVIYLSIIAFCVLTITTFTYQLFHHRYETKAAEAFFVMMSTKDSDQKISQVKTFVNDYQASPYASLARLLLIADDLDKGNWQGVDMQVQSLTKNKVPEFVADQAYILQARRFLATNQPQKALDKLSKLKPGSQVTYYLVQGLAEKQLGHTDDATKAFMKANELLSKVNPDSSLKNFIWYQQAQNLNHE